MIKYFCDCCGKQTKDAAFIEIPCHHWSNYSPGGGYQDNNGNQISSRKDRIELCNRCYNVLWANVRKAASDLQAINYMTLAELEEK